MVRYIPIPKFNGVNEKGLTYNEIIQKHVQNLIDTFLCDGKKITDKEGKIEWMNIANVSNARFVLGIYYERELDLLVPESLAKELKKKIEDSIGLGQLLIENGAKEDDMDNGEDKIEVYHNYLKNIGWELFNFLDQYIKIHDSVFSWWNILRMSKFFYKKIPFLTIIFVKIKNIEDRVKFFVEKNNLDNASKDYVDCLIKYAEALNKAIIILEEWLRMMGDFRNPNEKAYSKEEIDRIYNNYKMAQKEYVEIGWKLKSLYGKL